MQLSFPVPSWLSSSEFTAMQETQQIQVRPLGLGDPLEKEMAIHSSILAWEIPWKGERGRLQSMELQKS